MTADNERTAKIRQLNDAFRRTGAGGTILVTQGIQALSNEQQREIILNIKRLETFDPENDPYGEHDFAAIPVGNQKVFFKIDYYNAELNAGSENPADPNVTTRVMTIMLSHEY